MVISVGKTRSVSGAVLNHGVGTPYTFKTISSVNKADETVLVESYVSTVMVNEPDSYPVGMAAVS